MLILHKLWQEGLSPSERFLKQDGQYSKTLTQLCLEEDKLRAELSDRGNQSLESYNHIMGELHAISEEAIFIEAFRLGAQFIMDIVSDYQSDFTD